MLSCVHYLAQLGEDSQLIFTEWLQTLKPLVDLAAGLGLATVFLTYFNHTSERRRWRNFKLSVYDWIDRLIEAQSRHPRELSDDEWKIACERMLSDANFSPIHIHQLLEISVIVAKGIASERLIL